MCVCTYVYIYIYIYIYIYTSLASQARMFGAFGGKKDEDIYIYI